MHRVRCETWNSTRVPSFRFLLANLPHQCLSINGHRYPDAPVRSGFDVEVGFRICRKDECTDLSWNRPHHAFGRPGSIVGNDDTITILTSAQHRDDALTAITESMLEEFVRVIYDKSYGQPTPKFPDLDVTYGQR
jgi:hypothetical protein